MRIVLRVKKKLKAYLRTQPKVGRGKGVRGKKKCEWTSFGLLGQLFRTKRRLACESYLADHGAMIGVGMKCMDAG